jgi:hypothetical protein
MVISKALCKLKYNRTRILGRIGKEEKKKVLKN